MKSVRTLSILQKMDEFAKICRKPPVIESIFSENDRLIYTSSLQITPSWVLWGEKIKKLGEKSLTFMTFIK